MIQQMNVADLKKILDKDANAQLIDVREEEEFMEIRAPRAQLIALSEFSPEKVERLVDTKSAPIYLICRSGGRSMQAAKVLDQAGFSNLINIEGGTLAWVKHGFETAAGE